VEAAGVELDTFFEIGLICELPMENNRSKTADPLEKAGRPPNCPQQLDTVETVAGRCYRGVRFGATRLPSACSGV